MTDKPTLPPSTIAKDASKLGVCAEPNELMCNAKKNVRELHNQLDKARTLMREMVADKRLPSDMAHSCRLWLKGVK